MASAIPTIWHSPPSNGGALVGVTGQFFQVQAILQATTGALSPTLVDVTVTYGGP